ncbi:MAG: pyridoxine 5'-phosphate synthase [Opitutia bacterium]|jgi:pyridoxine 5-phosphate synthase
MSRVRLGVNVDHAATVRQARYRGEHLSPHAEPDLAAFAAEALAGGADGITVHLREDRRHLQDSDLPVLLALPGCRLNLEMACTGEMAELAARLRPAAACLVPESREEVTTEGGLDAAGQLPRVRATTAALAAAGIEVSLFIDPVPAQVDAAKAAGAPVIELHTGRWARAFGVDSAAAEAELARLESAARQARALGLVVNAGHGVNYRNARIIRGLPFLNELNIGHSIVARSLLVGARGAVAEMRAALG